MEVTSVEPGHPIGAGVEGSPRGRLEPGALERPTSSGQTRRWLVFGSAYSPATGHIEVLHEGNRAAPQPATRGRALGYPPNGRGWRTQVACRG